MYYNSNRYQKLFEPLKLLFKYHKKYLVKIIGFGQLLWIHDKKQVFLTFISTHE